MGFSFITLPLHNFELFRDEIPIHLASSTIGKPWVRQRVLMRISPCSANTTMYKYAMQVVQLTPDFPAVEECGVGNTSVTIADFQTHEYLLC
jgi:hypothetical protein